MGRAAITSTEARLEDLAAAFAPVPAQIAALDANVKHWEHALLRPEIRFDRASLPVFDAHESQISLGMGLSYIY